MFQGKTVFEIFQIGGFTMYILLFCSFISVTILLERLLYYRKLSKTGRTEFMNKIKRALKNGHLERAMEICKDVSAPFSNVIHSGLELHGRHGKEISNAMEREITIETAKLERYTSIVATIGNTAVYIGLFGTVLGIIRAFHDIASAGAGGMAIVIGGVAEALVCTATGLFVAIPAVVAYNYFTKRVERFIDDMELCASELIDLIGGE
ncbi:MAG TPA: MotA/TolQ/ExbB proton channel family protein [Thermodesulfobacteriota bacterium]|nr:MotA/TolQ/ExbB proton channel family protein [Thermodesulfobacteriota bacterium]